MRQVVLETDNPRFRWIDVSGPEPHELEALAAEYGLHPLAVQDCLDSEHRPKYEKLGGITFVILRAIDERAGPHDDTMQKVTRKVALFFTKELLVTVHRVEMSFLEAIKQKAGSVRPSPSGGAPACAPHVIAIANGVIDTFWPPLDAAENAISALEERPVGYKDRGHVIHETFHLKRRINALRLTARHTLETVKRLCAAGEEHLPGSPFVNDLKENAETLYFATDEIMEDANNLLSLELAGRSLFPEWQFSDDGVRPGLRPVLALLRQGGRGALAADALMRTPVEDARTPADLFAAGDTELLRHYLSLAGGP